MSNAILSVEQLKKTYGKKRVFTAVDSISFALKPGEILGLLGPNGSGKTTTIQMLLGTLSATEGSIRYFGLEFPQRRTEILRWVSFASTYTSLPYLLTIDQNLEFYGRLYGIEKIAAKTAPLLERFGILDKRDLPVSSLSAGQITRLMLVKAFFTDPKIVILDEPTASLDPDISKDVCNDLLEQREKRGLSILFTSHKMDEVAELCDRTIFLKGGKIIANDTPKNLAKSISLYQLQLTIIDGMKRTVAIAEEKAFLYSVAHRNIELSLDEKEIPPFLSQLVRADVSYASIRIQEPSLEDYFLKLLEHPL
jgi:ABC-2 type transport system ATP-binding protein